MHQSPSSQALQSPCQELYHFDRKFRFFDDHLFTITSIEQVKIPRYLISLVCLKMKFIACFFASTRLLLILFRSVWRIQSKNVTKHFWIRLTWNRCNLPTLIIFLRFFNALSSNCMFLFLIYQRQATYKFINIDKL